MNLSSNEHSAVREQLGGWDHQLEGGLKHSRVVLQDSGDLSGASASATNALSAEVRRGGATLCSRKTTC